MVSWRLQREPQSQRCWAVLTFASVPLCGGDESSGPSVFHSTSSLTLLFGAAGGPARPPLFPFFFFFKVCVCVRPYQYCSHPLAPSEWPPLGKLAGQPPFFFLHCCSLQTESAVVCHVASVYAVWVQPQGLDLLFSLPLSFKHVTGAELLRFESCPGPRQL